MPTEITIYSEQDLDLDQVVSVLDDFIHEQGWCGCDSPDKGIAIWSARKVDYDTEEADNAAKLDDRRG